MESCKHVCDVNVIGSVCSSLYPFSMTKKRLGENFENMNGQLDAVADDNNDLKVMEMKSEVNGMNGISAFNASGNLGRYVGERN